MAQREKDSAKKLATEEEMKRDFELMLSLEEVEFAVELRIVPAKRKKVDQKMERKPQ